MSDCRRKDVTPHRWGVAKSYLFVFQFYGIRRATSYSSIVLFRIMSLPLEVLADLRLAVDGEDIEIRGTGDHVVVDLPSLRAGRRLLSSGPFATDRAQATGQVHEALQISGLTAEVRLRGDPIARLGVGARPGAFGRFLNLDGVEVRPTRPVRAALRRRPLVTAGVILGLLVLIGWWVLRDETA
jgi:hypothetical protein